VSRTSRRVAAAVPVVAAALLACGALVVAGCSDDDRAPATSDGPVAPSTDGGATDQRPLRVDLIAPALDAIEAELGPQRYFEVNATSSLVNVFVADESAGTVTPYVFVDGELSARDPSPAEGATFDRDALDDLDPERVTGQVSAELPDSIQDAFVVEGGLDGTVRYSLVVSSSAGGQLLVVVAGDGTVLSVDTVD
jgi:hypothetical protein